MYLKEKHKVKYNGKSFLLTYIILYLLFCRSILNNSIFALLIKIDCPDKKKKVNNIYGFHL